MRLFRQRGRVIDYLRKMHPGVWTYDPRRFAMWQSETHEAMFFSHIADAEREMFQSHLHIFRRGDRCPMRQIPWGPAYFA